RENVAYIGSYSLEPKRWHCRRDSLHFTFVDIIGALGRTDPVFADERKRHIAEYVAGRGRARIGELAELFAVTEQTIRKDLRALDGMGLIKRTHGGVLALEPIDRELTGRETFDEDAALRVGSACVELLSDGDAAFLDGG